MRLSKKLAELPQSAVSKLYAYVFFQVKYCVLLCGDDDDPEIVKAASGALAMLTSQSAKICKKVFDVSITKT